jgi:SAM-dependent methyltransferase
VQPEGDRLPFADELYDVVIAELALDARPESIGMIADLVRVSKPGGALAVASLVRGSWQEVLDLLDEVLQRRGRLHARAALSAYVAAMPDAEALAHTLEAAGIGEVEVELERWELLFRSPRELLYAPVLEHGPLPRWKELVGKGAERQETFIALAETLDTYFAGRPLSVSVVAASVAGRKPPAAPSRPTG